MSAVWTSLLTPKEGWLPTSTDDLERGSHLVAERAGKEVDGAGALPNF